MVESISSKARTELLDALAQRYRQGSKAEKTRILDEFVKVSRCHRKSAIRLLAQWQPDSEPHTVLPLTDHRVYGEAVKQALVVLWEASDRICAKRLKAALPILLGAMQRHGHLSLAPSVRARVLAVSAATIDRLLKPVRDEAKPSRARRRSPSKPARKVPIKTFTEWLDTPPGALEIDLVAHCGGDMSGPFIHSLVATDVCSGWVEAVPLLAREQSIVVAGLKVIGERFPVPICGINSDNDSAFINETLIDYCSAQGIEFTRSRAYRKNDQAWIEQKNGAVVRRLMGYDRYSGLVAGQAMAALYAASRLYVNYFQPSFKLRDKTRIGARVTKTYLPPATPCSRLLDHADVLEAAKDSLIDTRCALDPIALLHRIREAQGALAALSTDTTCDAASRESLEQFLSGLPTLWLQGEARPTHSPKPAKARDWRTRADPFEGVWSDILEWFQNEPGLDARELLSRLQTRYPGRFTDGQKRTLQRRLKEWRNILARSYVFHGMDGAEHTQPVVPIGTPSASRKLR